MPMQPTTVTQMHHQPTRPVQALSEEDGRLRAITRRGSKVRITFEAEVADALLSSAAGDLRKKLLLVVTAPDGRRHTIDTELAGWHIEAVEGEHNT